MISVFDPKFRFIFFFLHSFSIQTEHFVYGSCIGLFSVGFPFHVSQIMGISGSKFLFLHSCIFSATKHQILWKRVALGRYADVVLYLDHM